VTYIMSHFDLLLDCLFSIPYGLSKCKISFDAVALAVREIFTGVCKFISRLPKLGHVPFHLDFACRQSCSVAEWLASRSTWLTYIGPG